MWNTLCSFWLLSGKNLLESSRLSGRWLQILCECARIIWYGDDSLFAFLFIKKVKPEEAKTPNANVTNNNFFFSQRINAFNRRFKSRSNNHEHFLFHVKHTHTNWTKLKQMKSKTTNLKSQILFSWIGIADEREKETKMLLQWYWLCGSQHHFFPPDISFYLSFYLLQSSLAFEWALSSGIRRSHTQPKMIV